MRPTIEQWQDDEHLEILRGWARRGLTFKEIASNIGIHKNTLKTWRDKSEKLKEALETTKEIANMMVENALYIDQLLALLIAKKL